MKLSYFSAFAVLLLPAVARCQGTAHPTGQGQARMSMGRMNSANRMSPSKRMQSSMMNMKSMTMSGNTDRDFASLMAEHHESAVKMARLELKYGKDPVLKRMSRAIIASQSKERKILLAHSKM